MLMGLNNIDKLMTDKVNDYILIEEQPLPITVGNKTIFIGNLTIDNNYKFWEMYGKLMANIGAKFVNFDLIKSGEDLYTAIVKHKKLYKGLIKIIKKTILKQQCYYLDKTTKERKGIKFQNCSWRYFKKNITIEKLIQICYLIYLYNFDAEKKNFKIILNQMVNQDEEKQLMETYMYFWLQNLVGLTGKFQLAQLTNVEYWDNPDEQETESVDKKVSKKAILNKTHEVNT